MKLFVHVRSVPSLLLIVISVLWWAQALAASTSEQQIKTAYLFNFTKFVKWPPETFANKKSVFQFCLLGKDPFGKFVNVITKKTIRGRAVRIRRLDGIAKIDGCQILFISALEKKRLKKIFQSVSQQPILTVGEMPGFASNGGMVNFYQEKNAIRFEINWKRARRAGLKISSTMLQAGRVVEGKEEL
jgi:hypothetical protein